MPSLFEPLTFSRGPAMKNRFMLAPMTNCQSHTDGRISADEHHWLVMRARGGFALTMTCAAHVQALGQGFPGQLGIFSDTHIEGLTRLATELREAGSLAVVQLHHAGMRSPEKLIGATPLCPSENEETGARAMTEVEVEQLIEDFVGAAKRAESAGFDGVEIHGAHGYVLSQFLSSQINRREGRYGGSLENRARPLFEVVAGIRARCGPDFNVSVRLSPENCALELQEVRQVAQRLMSEGAIDFLDVSLWDVFKEPELERYQGRSLMSYFTDLERGQVRLGVAGKIATAGDAQRCLDEGADYVSLGRAAILHHDFPRRVRTDPGFEPTSLPVTREYLRHEGLGEAFVDYMTRWKGFVSD